MVVPLPPVPVGGLSGKSVIRSLVETLSWFSSLDSTECIIMRESIKHLTDTTLGRTHTTGWADGRQCFRLPVSLDSPGFVTVVSEGWGSRPDCIPPLSQAAETDIIRHILSSLDATFGLNLCLAPCYERDAELLHKMHGQARLEENLLIVGGSHASRLADALGEGGSPVDRVTAPGWKVSSDNVADMMAKLATLSVRPDCIILQLLDNNAYFCLQEDGTMAHPTRGADGLFHTQGVLKVASKDQTRALMKILLPVLNFLP